MGAARIVRREKYAWPGGYELALVMDDGELLCAQCVHEEFHNISTSHRHAINDGWRPAGITHAGEHEEAQYCSHCGKQVFE